jgi:putative tricarboxylic transport membrane protein
MFVLGILAAGPMIRALAMPEVYIAAFVVLFAYMGAFALRQSISDVWIMTGFGVLGIFMVRGGYPLAPLVLGAILGPLAERYFNTTMIRSQNDWTVFFTRPLSATLLAICVLTFALLAYRAIKENRRTKAVLARGAEAT